MNSIYKAVYNASRSYTDSVGANAAALAALKPLDNDGDTKFSFSAGTAERLCWPFYFIWR